jgi:hypothetical protein
VVPHISARETHQRPWKISFVTLKRLFQQYLPLAEVNALIRSPRRRCRGAFLRSRAVLDVADAAPSGCALTPYDEEHLVTYLRLLDADAEGADWRVDVESIARVGREPLDS